MNYELESLKREFDRLKFDVSRKVENEDFQIIKHELYEANNIIGDLTNRIYELDRKLIDQQGQIDQLTPNP